MHLIGSSNQPDSFSAKFRWVSRVCSWQCSPFRALFSVLNSPRNRCKSITMPFKKIDHLNIVVQDLEAARNFFTDLGFIILTKGRLEGGWIDKIVNLPDVQADYIALA